ncbi:MAG: hypothetical protein FWE13_02385 [Firmicutes bacterium]|nr:hypothetical protein [Bacillota bacterium]
MRDLVSYISDTVDSVVNRRSRNEELERALNELNQFIQDQRPTIPDRPELPGVPEFERQQVTVRTDDELSQLASDKLAGERLAQERAIETRIFNQERDLTTARQNAEISAKEQKEALASNIERAENAINNDVLRRGLARSSIAVNRQADLAEQHSNQAQAIAGNKLRAIEQIDNGIASLVSQRDQALADFNVTHAARLTQAIHQLRTEQDKAVRDATAFNNNVAELERRAEIERQERSAALHQRELDILARERELTGGNGDPIFNKMVQVLITLSPSDARRQIIENPIFRENLSPQQFYRLFDQFARN